MVEAGEKINLNQEIVIQEEVMIVVQEIVQGIVHEIVETGKFHSKYFNSIFICIQCCFIARHTSEKSTIQKSENVGGIIKLPPNVNVNVNDTMQLSLNVYLNKTVTNTASPSPFPAKQLFNPNNPNKPIVISSKQQNTRGGGYPPINVETHHAKDHYPMNINSSNTQQQYTGAHFGNPTPAWYDPYTER